MSGKTDFNKYFYISCLCSNFTLQCPVFSRFFCENTSVSLLTNATEKRNLDIIAKQASHIRWNALFTGVVLWNSANTVHQGFQTCGPRAKCGCQYSILCSGGSIGGRIFMAPSLAPTFLERYKVSNFEYIVYCKYS